jgi:hypothetical protein
MVAEFNESAQRLVSAIVGDHPDWQAFAFPYGPADDAEALPGSVRFLVPVPHEPTHRLDVALRGNAIEVAYECGQECGCAEQQFVFGANEHEPAIAAVREFVRALCQGRTVVVRERLGPVVRALRRDGVSELAWFRSAAEVSVAPPGKYLAIHLWSAIGDGNDSD